MSRIDFRISHVIGASLLLASASAFSATETVTPEDGKGWFATDEAGDAMVQIGTGQATGAGSGSLEFALDTTDDRIAAAKLPLISLDDITGIGYSYYTNDTTVAPVLKIQYWSLSGFGTLNWEPATPGNGGAPVTGSWQNINGMNGVWWNTANGGTPANAQSLSDWQSDLDNPLVQFIKVGVGSGWNAPSSPMWADLVSLTTAEGNTVWDFETEEPGLLPPVDPADETALIRVIKIFDDGNDETPVTVTLQCNAGSYAPDQVTIEPESGGMISAGQHIFVVGNIPNGPDNLCTVTESGTSGYTGAALCGGDGDPNEDCLESADDDDRLAFCQFDNLQVDDVAECILVNTPDPVEVEVTKVWEFFGADIIEVDTEVRLTLVCDAEIVGGTTWFSDDWYKTVTLSGSDYFDEDGVDIGMGTAEFSVIPEWYSTSDDPEDQRYTTCYVKEDASDLSAVDVDNGCGEDFGEAEIMVKAGMGDSCTVTNTVFFEGIPTLSQYGMAIMALLMLGLGFVGMRRFV